MLLLLLIGFTGEAYARAGGGGSYRSSGGSSSSSRSSSSSSSRSSSSSSYRPSSSSSSSSYRPGSSGSSTHRSGSSSHYSAPSHTYLHDFEAIKRRYELLPAGRILVKETLTFIQKAGPILEYAYFPAVLAVPFTIINPASGGASIARLRLGAGTLFFTAKLPRIGANTVELSYTIEPAATPTTTGAFMDIDIRSDCRTARTCVLDFAPLPSAGNIQLLAPPHKITGVNRIIREFGGAPVAFDKTTLSGVAKIRVNLVGEAPKAFAQEIWKSAKLNTTAATAIQVEGDGTVSLKTQVEYTKGDIYGVLAFLTGPKPKQRYLVADLSGVRSGDLSNYSPYYLNLELKPATYGFTLFNAVVKNPEGGQRIILPVSAMQENSTRMTENQQTIGFITWQKTLDVWLPDGVEGKASLLECTFSSGDMCSQIRGINHEATATGNLLQITPLEAQTTGLWLLQIDITKGRLASPGLWKRMRAGLAHHAEFGQYPRWVPYFYFFVITGGLILLIVVFVFLSRRKHRRLEEQKLLAIEGKALGGLIKRDPAFNAEAFRLRGRQIAEKIQHAWCAGDMRECRRYLSQGVYNRFRLQLKIMRDLEKRQNAMADFKILKFYILNHNRSGNFDCITVRLEAEARDIMVDADLSTAEAQKAAKSASSSAFTEFYSFMRRRDAKTLHRENLDACSHCGTPFTSEGEITKCKSCGSVMGSGTFDWVLAEITQNSEYKGHRQSKIATQAVSADRIEDRASFVFWRDMMTRLSGKKDFIARDATEAYLKKAGASEPLSDIAVGAAELEHYDDALSPLTAGVRIKWSAKGAGDKEPRHRESVLSLVAKPGDEEGTGFAEHSCPACGAPLPETDSHDCSYCRSPIQSQNADWLLEAIATTVE